MRRAICRLLRALTPSRQSDLARYYEWRARERERVLQEVERCREKLVTEEQSA